MTVFKTSLYSWTLLGLQWRSFYFSFYHCKSKYNDF